MGKLPPTKKHLGQHYLKDQQLIAKICNDFSSQAAGLVEVGPGPGILTKELAALNRPLIVLEKDPRFLESLQKILPLSSIFIADALICPLAEILKEQQLPAPLWLVSNLPYNISVPLLMRFLQIPEISYLTLMFQQEVAEKILPPPLQKNTTNSLMCLLQNYFDIRLLAKARPGAFLPPPQVDSMVLSFTRLPDPAIPLTQSHAFEEFLRKLFAWRRKQLGKVLAAQFPTMPVAQILQEVAIVPNARAETLSLSQILAIYRALSKSK